MSFQSTLPNYQQPEPPEQRQSQRTRTSVHGRSVLDYETENELLRALTDVNLQEEERGERSETSVNDEAAAPATTSTTTSISDWRLPVPDPHAEEQTPDGELQRLLTLKSYLALDAEKERAFDKLTEEACQIFGVPTSLISLIDLGRQFLFSNTGNPVRETSRRVAFCSHTILNRQGICIVADTACDARFQSNPLVKPPNGGSGGLRFYAGAPLISPEGYKLGTFCVEGPDPRPAGLTPAEQAKLKEYAARAMELLVQRRERLTSVSPSGVPASADVQQANSAGVSSSNGSTSNELRRHAGVTTNLGGILYTHGMCLTAMRLFQESVQTLMHIDEPGSSSSSAQSSLNDIDEDEHGCNGVVPSLERQTEMAQLLTLLQVESIPSDSRQELMEKVARLYQPQEHQQGEDVPRHECDPPGIPGLFHTTTSKLRGVADRRPLSGLMFGEAFKINMEADGTNSSSDVVDDRQFIIPLDQCSKATLFNMGLIHYHWGAPDTALQFFDLAASLSNIARQQQNPLAFDPVVLGCLNNMAHIHLQYGRPASAMEMLQDALARGNAALTAIYQHYSTQNLQQQQDRSNTDAASSTADRPASASPVAQPLSSSSSSLPLDASSSVVLDEQDSRRARRLRRKLARTTMNIGHVLFFNCEYDASMASCRDALRLLEQQQQVSPPQQDVEMAALWYNMSVLYYHQGKKVEALTYLDRYLEQATLQTNSSSSQTASTSPTTTAVALGVMAPTQRRASQFQVAEALYRKGKIMFEMGNLYECMKPLNEALRIQRGPPDSTAVADGPNGSSVTETLCLIGKVYLAREEYDFALNALKQCLELQRQQQSNNAKDLTFQVAQTLLEVGRAHHGTGDLKSSLAVYLEVADLTRQYFGARHAFVARIDSILGNLYLESGKIDESLSAFAEATKIRVEQGLPVDMNLVVDQQLAAASAAAAAGGVKRRRSSCQQDQHSVAPTA